MSTFILEIGTEELPARFLPGQEAELAQRFAEALQAANLPFEGLEVCSTPRRAAVYIKNVADNAALTEEVVTGPPLKAAYGPDGAPTKAAEGFARTHGMELAAAFTLKTEKGEYLALRKTIGGGAAKAILEKACPEIISALGFAKRMKWGSGDFTYARPLRWLLALLGKQPLDFSVGGVKSGNLTYGHRVHGPGPFQLDEAAGYFDLMREKAHVVPRAAERRQIIIEKGNAMAAKLGGRIIWKEALLDEVQGLCELPEPLLGAFSPEYLEVPREVLLTSMQAHQKSFGLESAGGELLPNFLTVLNLRPKDENVVRKGWERVLRARLEDARFFWKTDLAANFDGWLAALDNVIFLAPLGSMGDKTRRLAELCAWLAERLSTQNNPSGPNSAAPVSVEDARRAGRLSKADLVSGMVGEFDTLQGIMGGIYAARKGESPTVAAALAGQYLPAGPESPVPADFCGALLSIADKADTLAGCFGLGMIPTGAADPYGLRRAALGIARILREKKLRLPIAELFAKAFSLYGERKWKLPKEEALAKLEEFFTLRLKNYFMGSDGAETLLVESVLAADASDVWAASARLSALAAFSREADFGMAVLAFKRAANIIRKQAANMPEGKQLDGHYKPELLREDAEKALAASLESMFPRFEELWNKDDFAALFALLRELRPSVDAFFDGVMVMCEDKDLSHNRLNLLQALVSRLRRLADFDALQM